MDIHIQKAYNIPFEGLNILECGSHEGGDETAHSRSKNQCYYIDAINEHAENMKRKYDVNPNNVFCFALGESDGEVEFTETSHPGNSSFHHLPEHIDELQNQHNSFFRTYKVPMKSYASFLELIDKVIDILILDIEGAEAFVLRGMKTLPVNKLPKILCIEAGYDWNVRKEILQELGYIIDYYDYNNVVLHHSSFIVSKNEEYVREMNLNNKQFVWSGKVIYQNDLV